MPSSTVAKTYDEGGRIGGRQLGEDHMGEEAVSTWMPLAAVLLGAFVVHFSTTRLEQKRRMHDAKALAGMLAAEIDTTIRHAERRGYEAHYRHFLKRFEAGNFSEMPSIRGMDDKLPDIAAASVDRLGLLDPELSRDVVSWYGSLRGIKIDLLELGTGKVPHEECAPLLREALEIWVTDLNGKAPSLVERLRGV